MAMYPAKQEEMNSSYVTLGAKRSWADAGTWIAREPTLFEAFALRSVLPRAAVPAKAALRTRTTSATVDVQTSLCLSHRQ